MFLLEHDDVKAVGELLNIAWAVHEMTGEHAGKVINFLTSDPHETYPGATIPKFINNSTNYKKLGEGFDVPELDTLVLATPKSDVEQAVGRILRQKNKNEPIVIDIVDSFSIFKGQYYKRRKFYKSCEFKINV